MKKSIAVALAICLAVTAWLGCVPVFSADSETPEIASFSISDFTVYEGLDSQTSADETGEDYLWFEDSRIRGVAMSVTMKDGTVHSFSSLSELGDFLNRLSNSSGLYDIATDFGGLQAQEHWKVGNTYEIAAQLVDHYSYYLDSGLQILAETTCKVTVAENPVVGIEIEDVTLYEGIDGSAETDWETGETYRRYSCSPSVAVSFRDGTQQEGFDSITYDGESYRLSTDMNSLQQEEHWSGGNTYTVTGEIAGMTAPFEVTVAENPVVGIEVENITLYEGLDSVVNTDWQTGETYSFYAPTASYFRFTVTFRDGTKKSSDADSSVEVLPGRIWWLGTNFWEPQQDEHWTAGNTYTVTGEIAGVTAPFEVTIAENPVVGINVEDVTLLERLDGYTSTDWETGEEFFCYQPYPTDFTVTFRDGTKQKSDFEGRIQFGGRYYDLECDGTWESQQEEHWAVGKTYEITGRFAGITDAFQVKIEEGYESLTISGKSQLILSFRKKNGKTETYRVTGFDEQFAGGDEEGTHTLGGILYTDRKIFPIAYFELDRTNGGFVLQIGDMKSNRLTESTFLEEDATTVDTNGDEEVTSDDAVYLLYHIFKPEDYPLSAEQNCDFNGDGLVTSDDAIYLLYHIFLPEKYPI